MELNTFGAIMGFAVEMIQQTVKFYQQLLTKTQDPSLKELFQSLLGEEQKNHALIEKTRRENVTEIILEPITGLHQKEYQIETKKLTSVQEADFLKIARMLEEREQRFFNDVSNKIPFPEVARIFRKLAQKKETALVKLRSPN